MLQRTLAKALGSQIDQKVLFQGFVDVIRDQKTMLFVILSDHTGKVQLAIDKTSQNEIAQMVTPLGIGSAVSVIGVVKKNTMVKLGGVEIVPDKIEIESAAEIPLPIDKDSGVDLRLDWHYIWLRQPKFRLIFEVETLVEKAMRDFWINEGFIEIHSPKIISTASESGAEVFKVDYFGRDAYLAQSPQFYKQMAMAAGFDRVFEIAPVFRADPSTTTRHASEFISVDAEMAWIKSHEEVMQMEEQMLHHVLSIIHERYDESIFAHFGVHVVVPPLPFPRVSLAEARSMLSKSNHKIDHKADLDPEGERRLCQIIKKNLGHEFVFVTDYPSEVRAFYHMRHQHDDNLTKSFDLLWKGVEITTGAQREHRYRQLIQQAIEKGLTTEALQTYFDFFKFGCPPHGGCGIGLARIIMKLFECERISDVSFVFRNQFRLNP
jgi:aspartyl-tRNA synthetase